MTIFLIVGILILAIVGASLFIFSKVRMPTPPEKTLKIEELKMTAKSQMNYCLEKSTKDAVYFIGMQGGYYFAPAVHEYYLGTFVPYYFYKREILLPGEEEREKQLSSAIKYFLPSCLEEIKKFFEREGVEMSYKIREIKAKIGVSEIMVEASLPVIIGPKGTGKEKEEERELGIVNQESLTDMTLLTEMTYFMVKVELNYNRLDELSREIIQLQAQDPEWFPLGEIAELAYEKNFTFEILAPETAVSEGEAWEGERQELREEPEEEDRKKKESGRNKVLISLVDYELFDQPYYFTFGIYYDVNFEEKFAEDILEEEALEEE